jgi:hypothetical protein
MRAHWSSWIGPCASFLCLVHCIGLGVLAVAAPGLARFLPHSEFLDWIVWLTVFVSGAASLRRLSAGRNFWIALNSLSGVTLLALLFERHDVAHVTTLALACVQLPLLVRHFKGHGRSTPPPTCCEHEHQRCSAKTSA